MTNGTPRTQREARDFLKGIEKIAETPIAPLIKLSKKEGSPVQSSALDVQVAGDHYKLLAIQPIEYIHANGIHYMEGNVVKYITRHRDKNGAADVRKALHYCQLILELQYGEKP